MTLIKDSSSISLESQTSTLSIQSNKDGFFIYVLDSEQESSGCFLSYFDSISKRDFTSLKTSLNQLISDKKQDFSGVIITHNFLPSAFIPKELFFKNLSEDYLKANCHLDTRLSVLNDSLDNEGMVNVYQADTEIETYLPTHFKNIKHRHSATTLFLELYYNFVDLRSFNPQVFIDTSLTNHFRLFVFKGRKLLIHNVFEYKDVSSFAYYLLYTLKQLRINPSDAIFYELKSFSSKLSSTFESLKNYGLYFDALDLSGHINSSIPNTANIGSALIL